MNAFDTWHSSIGGSHKKVKWGAPKRISYWEQYQEAADIESGEPFIICIVCNHSILKHPAIHGNKAMSVHVDGKNHCKNVEALRRKTGESSVSSIKTLLARQGKMGVKVYCRFVYIYKVVTRLTYVR